MGHCLFFRPHFQYVVLVAGGAGNDNDMASFVYKRALPLPRPMAPIPKWWQCARLLARYFPELSSPGKYLRYGSKRGNAQCIVGGGLGL